MKEDEDFGENMGKKGRKQGLMTRVMHVMVNDGVYWSITIFCQKMTFTQKKKRKSWLINQRILSGGLQKKGYKMWFVANFPNLYKLKKQLIKFENLLIT